MVPYSLQNPLSFATLRVFQSPPPSPLTSTRFAGRHQSRRQSKTSAPTSTQNHFLSLRCLTPRLQAVGGVQLVRLSFPPALPLPDVQAAVVAAVGRIYSKT